MEIIICSVTLFIAGLTYLFIKYVDVVFDDPDDN